MQHQRQPFNIRATLSPQAVQDLASRTIAKMDANKAAYHATTEGKTALAQYAAAGGFRAPTNLQSAASDYDWLVRRGE
jgi:hypothetical protein